MAGTEVWVKFRLGLLWGLELGLGPGVKSRLELGFGVRAGDTARVGVEMELGSPWAQGLGMRTDVRTGPK